MQKMEALKKELTKENSLPDKNLEVLLESFYGKMLSDTMLGFFFQGKDLKHIVEQQKSLLMMVMGFKKTYEGKPVNQAHQNLPPILPGHFDRRLVLLKETLQENNISLKAQEEWLSFENQFRNVIVK